MVIRDGPGREDAASGDTLFGGSRSWIWLAGLGALLCAGAIIAPLPALALVLAGLGLLLLLRWWPVSGMVLLMLTAHLTHFKAEIGPVSVRPEHLAVMAVGGVLLWKALARKRPIVLDPPAFFALAWFGVNVLATMINAPDPSDSLRHIFRLGLMAATYCVVINLLETPAGWWTAFGWLLGLAVAQDAFGLAARALYNFGVNIGVQVTMVLPVPVPYGTLEEGNMFGSQSAAWLVLFVALFFVGPGRQVRRRLAGKYTVCTLLAACAITGTAVLLSLSRGAWVALLIGLALLFIVYPVSPRVRRKRALLLIVSLPIFLLVMAAAVELLPATVPLAARIKSFTTAVTDATFKNRLADIADAVADWQRHPFIGWGPGTFFQLHGMRWYAVAWIANQTARTLQETGILGLLAFWGFLASVFWVALRGVRRLQGSTPGSPERIGRAALLGLACGLLILQIAFQATDGTWLSYMWVHAALLTAGARLLPRGLCRAGLPRQVDRKVHCV